MGGFPAHLEQLSHQPRSVTKILLNKLTANNTQEGSRRLVGNSLGQECLASPRRTVEDDTLGRLDAHLLVHLRMQQGQLDRLSDFLDLLLQATNVRVRLGRGLVELHDADDGIRIIGQDPDDAHALVVQQNAGAGLEEILVDEAHDADVVLRAGCTAHDGMVIVDKLLQCPDTHGAPTHVVDTAALIGEPVVVGGVARGGALLRSLRLASQLLVLDILLLQQEMVVDALHA